MKDLFGEKVNDGADGRGKGKGMLRVIGASNCSLTERAAADFYATPPEAVEMLLGLEDFSERIVEPCCGMGHIGKVLEAHGHQVDARDLIDRGYGTGGMDFLRCADMGLDADIVTNPPYSMAREFVEKSLQVVGGGAQGGDVPQTHLPGGQGEKGAVRSPAAEADMGFVVAPGLREERRRVHAVLHLLRVVRVDKGLARRHRGQVVQLERRRRGECGCSRLR